MNNSVCTLYELANGDDTTSEGKSVISVHRQAVYIQRTKSANQCEILDLCFQLKKSWVASNMCRGWDYTASTKNGSWHFFSRVSWSWHTGFAEGITDSGKAGQSRNYDVWWQWRCEVLLKVLLVPACLFVYWCCNGEEFHEPLQQNCGLLNISCL